MEEENQGYELGETIPFTREVDAINFVKSELAKGHSVTIWPVNDQAHILAAQSKALA